MTIELKELAERLQELRDRIRAGEEVVLTDDGAAIGTVVPTPAEPPKKRQRILGLHPPGTFRPTPDFDDPLPDEFWLGGNP